MNELTVIENDKNFIPVYLTDKKEKVVKGRELHNGLCVKQDYSNWIKKQLEVVDATEKDFYKLTFKDEFSMFWLDKNDIPFKENAINIVIDIK